MAHPQRKLGYDPTQLGNMTEPLKLRIEKMKGGRSPVWMPGRTETDVDGDGYARTDVPIFEAVLPFWAGSGTYEAILTDASGQNMKWSMMFQDDANSYPPHRVPVMNEVRSFDELVGRAQQVQQTKAWLVGGVAGAPQPTQAPQQRPIQGTPRPPLPPSPIQSQWWAPQQPPVYDPYAGFYPPPQYPGYPPQPAYPPGFQGFAPQPFGMPGYPGMFPGAAPAPSNSEQELKLQLAKIEHERQRDQERAQFEAKMNSLQEEIRRLAETKKSDPDVETRRLEEQRRLDEERRREDDRRRDEERRREEDQRRRDEKHAAELKEMERRNEDRIRQMETTMTQANAQNALITFAQTSMSNQSTAYDRLAQMQRDSNDRALDFVKSQPNGADAMMRQAESLFALQGKAIDTIMGVQQAMQGPGEHPVERIAGNVMEKAQNVLSRFFRSKETEANANANIAAAKAAEAQANAATMGGIATGFAPPPPIVQGESAPISSDPGIPLGADGTAGVMANGGTGLNGAGTPVNGAVKKSVELQRDVELWGPALSEVQELRAAVYANRVPPEQCAAILFQARDKIQATGQMIPAFALWNAGKFDDLIEELLPKVAGTYRVEVIEHIVRGLKEQAAADNAEGPEPEDDADDEEEEEAPAPPPIEVKKAMTVQSARKKAGAVG